MLDTLLWTAAGFWVLFALLFAANVLLIPDISRKRLAAPPAWPFVSIVTPARNEERDIEAAVTSFCTQDYPAFEVVVVDDGSTDATPEILRRLADRFPSLRIVKGVEPPPGWLGKPNALEQGRRAARGEWIAFSDADVVYSPLVLRQAVAWAIQDKADMLALIPRLLTGGFWEGVLLSSLPMGILVVSPTFLVPCSRVKLVAAGGGVFNLVRKEALEAAGAFECLKQAIVDDIGLGYKVKRAGLKVVLALAVDLIRIRMYRGAWDLVRGFSKNTYPMLRRIPGLAALPFLTGALCSLLPYYGLVRSLFVPPLSLPALLSVILTHVVLAGLAIVLRLRWHIVFLNPLRELGLWLILLHSFIQFHRKGIVWRGRSYNAEPD